MKGGHGSLENAPGDMKIMMMATQAFFNLGIKVFCFNLDPNIVNSYVMD